jgi:deoxyribonuclease IV
MLVGVHVSAAGGLANAPANARKIGCEVFQIFSRPPQGGPAKPITEGVIKDFNSAMKINQQSEFYIHTPYYINLASTTPRIRYGSISVIRDELERGSLLGAKYVMTHLGSAKELSRKEAVIKVSHGIIRILDKYKGQTILLLENSAGSGNVIGDQFEELAEVMNQIPKAARNNVGICFDTCHAFSSNYDLRDKKSLAETLRKFDQLIGLDKLKLIHLNDSKTELGSKVDRHEHIGQGKIGLEGFKAVVNQPNLKKINLILETPEDEKGTQQGDLKVIKDLRD